mgnify:FL=1
MEILKAKELAIELMNKHKLIEYGWYFEFDKAKRRFGCCDYIKQRISLSEGLTKIREEHNVRNTILHEIAHALVGFKNGHNHIWRAKAIEIGCDGKRCGNDAKLEGKWKGVCPNGHVHFRYRKVKRKQSCGICLPNRYEEKYLINYQLNN